MNIQLGSFYGVAGVAMNRQYISILTRDGLEQLIPIQSYRGDDDIKISGEFGDFSNIAAGVVLPGLRLRDIRNVEVKVDFVDDDFHTRALTLENSTGTTITWSLFCEGQPA